ncbi:Uncharacterised protein [Mycobacterium xenopi]|nr:Uncharacterised protein [Mycobacterium xenopi]
MVYRRAKTGAVWLNSTSIRLICCGSPTPTPSWRRGRRKSRRRRSSRFSASHKLTARWVIRRQSESRPGWPTLKAHSMRKLRSFKHIRNDSPNMPPPTPPRTGLAQKNMRNTSDSKTSTAIKPPLTSLSQRLIPGILSSATSDSVIGKTSCRRLMSEILLRHGLATAQCTACRLAAQQASTCPAAKLGPMTMPRRSDTCKSSTSSVSRERTTPAIPAQ